VNGEEGDDADPSCGTEEGNACLTIAEGMKHFDDSDEKTIKLVSPYEISSRLELTGILIESSNVDEISDFFLLLSVFFSKMGRE
jgi:hypothetical protein